MHFFSKWLGYENHENQPEINFGRYSDSYKGQAQYHAWDLAQVQFEEGNVIEASSHFFNFLKDTSLDNVIVNQQKDKIEFTIYQGSKSVTGIIDGNKIRAEAKIAKVTELSLGFARKLLEQNFALKYSRFTLTSDGHICMVFDSNTADVNAYKLYYGLKELCLEADKKDDLLVDEFESLFPVNTGHIKPLPKQLIETRYQYLQDNISLVSNQYEKALDRLKKEDFGINFLFLNLIYKLDYLIKPEGFMMEKLEKIHFLYFNSSESATEGKNEKAKKYLQIIKDRTIDDFSKEQYDVLSTYGNATSVKYETISDLFIGQLPNIDWYISQKRDTFTIALCGYLIGFTLFSYAPPLPLKQLFHLYYTIIEHTYFKHIGFTLDFVETSGQLNKTPIIQAIEKIEEDNKESFPRLNFPTKSLDFRSTATFSASLIKLTLNLDLYEKPN